jgi:hypothetical protein
VGVGDRLHDREAETEPVLVSRAIAVEPLKGLEQPLDFRLGHDRSGVHDGDDRVSVPDTGHDLDPSLLGVVPHRVVDEVHDEAFDQARVALHGNRGERGVEHQTEMLRIRAATEDDPVGNGGEIEGLLAFEAGLHARQGQECVDEPLLLRARNKHAFVRSAQ